MELIKILQLLVLIIIAGLLFRIESVPVPKDLCYVCSPEAHLQYMKTKK